MRRVFCLYRVQSAIILLNSQQMRDIDMIKTFKEKAPTLQAIEFTSAMAQSAEVANLLGASALSVDMATHSATFIVPVVNPAPDALASISYPVTEGQVVGFLGAQVVIMAAADFYAKYEAI